MKTLNAKRLTTKAITFKSLVAVVLLSVVICHLSFVTPALAVVTLPPNPATSISPSSDASLPSKLINILITPMLSIIGFFAVFYIVLAGWKFVRSNGDPKGAEEAKGRLTFAIVGLVIVILAIAMAQLVDKLILGGTGVF